MIGTTPRSMLEALPSIGLAELEASAALQTRQDRKYLVSPSDLAAALAQLGDRARVLEIEERRRFAYRSTYFDTATHQSYLGAARGRPGRFKVRTRLYDDSGHGVIEVKVRSARGQTVKHRQEHPFDRPDELLIADLPFLNGFDSVRPHLGALRPALTTSYRRSTLVLEDGSRTTIDTDVDCIAPDGRVASFRPLIVETKGGGQPSPLDRILWWLHVRPLSVSKFGTGSAALHRDLPANKWRRALQAVDLT